MKPRTSLGVWRWIHSLNLVILLSLTIHHPRVRWPDMWNETWRHFPEYSLRTWDIQYLFLGTWCHMDIYADTISVCYCGNERLYSHEGWNEKGHLLTLNLLMSGQSHTFQVEVKLPRKPRPVGVYVLTSFSMNNKGRGRRAKVLADKFIEGIAKSIKDQQVHLIGKENTNL